MSRRGLGRMYRPKYTDKRTGERRQQAVWWIAYYRNGKKVRESSESTRTTDATRLLKRRIAEIEQGKPTGPDVQRMTFEHLTAILIADYEINGLRSIDRLHHALKRLRPVFGDYRAIAITPDVIDRYKAGRKREGAANATINRELSYVRRMFRLAHQKNLLPNALHVEMLKENNKRQGFVEREEFRRLLDELPPHHQGWAEIAYITGWRKDAVLSRQWSHIEGDDLILDIESSKNSEPYRWPLRDGNGNLTVLGEAVERQREYVREIERRFDRVIPWMFPYPDDGRRISHPEQGFKVAAKRAEMPELIIHDLRRSAVRNLSNAGVPESVIMSMCGMETRSIFDRYNISDDSRRKSAAARLTSVREGQRAPRKVASLDR